MLNNNITEDFCSLEVSKLLKEKGFKVIPEDISPTDHVIGFDIELDSGKSLRLFQWEDCECEHLVLRPTHSIAIKWIRENFGVYISIIPTSNPARFSFRLYRNNQGVMNQIYESYMSKVWTTVENTTEAALKYFLTELITEL